MLMSACLENEDPKTSSVGQRDALQVLCTVFLSSYRYTSGSLGEREMLWKHEPQASVSRASSSSPKLSRVFL